MCCPRSSQSVGAETVIREVRGVLAKYPASEFIAKPCEGEEAVIDRMAALISEQLGHSNITEGDVKTAVDELVDRGELYSGERTFGKGDFPLYIISRVRD